VLLNEEHLIKITQNYVIVEVQKMDPLKIVKISSNDGTPLIYLPKRVRERLNFQKGDNVILYADGNRLVVEKIQ